MQPLGGRMSNDLSIVSLRHCADRRDALLDSERHLAIIYVLILGYSIRTVARELGRDRSTVTKWVREHESAGSV